MSWITMAALRRDTPQSRAMARLLMDGGGGDAGHRLVWTLFGADPAAPRDFLYREAEPGRYIIVSTRKPEAESAIWALQSKPYAPALAAGQRYGFALRANPTVSVSQPGRARSHRADVVMHAKTLKGRPLSVEEREELIELIGEGFDR